MIKANVINDSSIEFESEIPTEIREWVSEIATINKRIIKFTREDDLKEFVLAHWKKLYSIKCTVVHVVGRIFELHFHGNVAQSIKDDINYKFEWVSDNIARIEVENSNSFEYYCECLANHHLVKFIPEDGYFKNVVVYTGKWYKNKITKEYYYVINKKQMISVSMNNIVNIIYLDGNLLDSRQWEIINKVSSENILLLKFAFTEAEDTDIISTIQKWKSEDSDKIKVIRKIRETYKLELAECKTLYDRVA